MPVAPGTYTFQISYGGASIQKNQNTATNPVITFQTVLVSMKLLSSTNAVLSGAGQYYASDWKTFTQDMELLPVAYTFHFNDGTPDTQVTITASATNHIH